MLPWAPVIGDSISAEALQSYFSGRGRHVGDDARVHVGIGDEPALADVLASGLELRLDERDDLGRPRDERRQHRERCAAAR